MKRIHFLATLTVVFGTAAASHAVGFVEEPGVMEFTGQMIVRPLPLERAIERTGSLLQAQIMRESARRMVLANTIEFIPETGEYLVNVPAGSNENAYASELMRTGMFQYAEPNWRVWPVNTPNDPQFPQQWHHNNIGSRNGWAFFTGSNAMIVAICDTGIDLTHPDLVANRLPGYNAVVQRREVDGGGVNDLNGHGTHVTGCAAAIGNNGVGVTGVGWNFRTMMIRVSDTSGGSSSIDVLTRGARWAAENGARVINTSYSGVSNAAVETTGQYVNGLGAVYLWAAGNSSANISTDHPSVVIVGATDVNNNRASFSNFGRGIDVVAPGVNILATTRGSSYGALSGTSMASPVAAGVFAMVYARNPQLTVRQVENLVFQNTVDLGTVGEDDTFGHGLVNLERVMRAMNNPPANVNPTTFNITRGSLVSGTLNNLFTSDDQFLVVRNGAVALPNESPITVTFEGTAPQQTASALTYRVEMRTSILGLAQAIRLFDFAANAYSETDSRNTTTSDQVVTLNGTNVNRYIQANTRLMRSQVLVGPVGPLFTNSWRASVDQAIWIVTP